MLSFIVSFTMNLLISALMFVFAFRLSLEITIETDFEPKRSIHQFTADLSALTHGDGSLIFPWDWSCMAVLGVSNLLVANDKGTFYRYQWDWGVVRLDLETERWTAFALLFSVSVNTVGDFRKFCPTVHLFRKCSAFLFLILAFVKGSFKYNIIVVGVETFFFFFFLLIARAPVLIIDENYLRANKMLKYYADTRMFIVYKTARKIPTLQYVCMYVCMFKYVWKYLIWLSDFKVNSMWS